jgi:hypothetical protein
MCRLLLFSLALFIGAQPAAAAVCETVLGPDLARLLNAPLWYQVGDRLLSPVILAAIGLALLTATRFPRLRGMALIAGLVAAVRAVTAIGQNVFPDQLLLSARIEGCGGASLATAIASSVVAVLLLFVFLRAPDPAARRSV